MKKNKMKFLFNFATRSRPEKFFRGVDSIVNNMSGKHDYEIIVTIDTDDASMNNEEVMAEIGARYADVIRLYRGESKNKIDAINRSIPHFGEFDVLVNMSDDMIFTLPNFDEVIAEKIGDDTDKYLHFRDTNHRKQDALCTMHIVGKKYFDRDKFVYHPDFISVYADNLNDDLAKSRGKYHFYPDVIFKHYHPAYHKDVERDLQYQRTEDRAIYARDRRTYQSLKKRLHEVA